MARGRAPGASRDNGGFLRTGLVGLLAVMVTACSSGGAKPEASAAAEAGPPPALIGGYQQALRLLDGGDEAGGEARLQSLAGEHPGYAGPLVNLALIRARHDDLDAAAALLERALAVCTNCATAWNALGVVQRRGGLFDEAERSYLAAIAADPSYGNAHFNLGVLYELYLQRPELALEQYTRFGELGAGDPGAEDVGKWVTDLQRRTGVIERTARVEENS